VEDAHGQPPSIPFWLGEAPARTHELSTSVSRLREEVAARIQTDEGGLGIDLEPALSWLTDEVGLSREAAEQIVEYLAGSKIVLGVMPSQDNLVLEKIL
jgi:ATP-dependent Lhr-like helicase